MSAGSPAAPGATPTRRPGRLAAALHHLRTEGGTPSRQAAAVAAGLYIGATPFLGFHLLLTMLVGRLFGLNRLLMYAAANISNPFVAPFLYATEIQIGAWVRTGRIYTPAMLDEIRLRGLALDVLIGSVIVGVALAAAGALATFMIVRARGTDPSVARLVEAAAAPFLTLGAGPWEFARGKIRRDPVYLSVLRHGVLPREGRFIDLGCGIGLMLSLLAAARERFGRGDWPSGWPAPPTSLRLEGIELRERIARRGQEALADVATIHAGDLSVADIPQCDAALLFDVLHLMTPEAQDRLLAAIARALAPHGVLVMREANPQGGWRFQMVRAGNRLVSILHGRRSRRFHFRTVAQWTSALQSHGFAVRVADDGGALTPFANVALYAIKSR
jgi:uncharacterized protein (DUF2062 family)